MIADIDEATRAKVAEVMARLLAGPPKGRRAIWNELAEKERVLLLALHAWEQLSGFLGEPVEPTEAEPEPEPKEWGIDSVGQARELDCLDVAALDADWRNRI